MKETTKKVRPLADRVLIKEDSDNREKKTSSGIIIPASADEKAGKRGEVVAVGPGRMEEGKVIPLQVKEGDRVIFQWGDKIKVGDEEYYIVRESEILAIIK